jgi:preprotein translocase subunit SecG
MLLTYIVSGLNVISALAMIVFVLLHSGRGGGLSDMFGGGAASAAAGSTVVERNLDRLTIIAGLIWIFTVVILALRLQ